jgi:signal transduction histidine kinase
LENNLVTHAFRGENITGLELLASQAAISLEIALAIQQRQLLFLKEKEARAEAEKALRARDEFMLIAAHELRTPLSPLKMQLDLLRRLVSREEFSKSFKAQKSLVDLFMNSDRQVDRLSNLIDELLDFSQISSGHLKLKLELLDLSSLAQSVVERYESECKQAGCVIELHAEKKVIGHWDRARIEQVAVHLLTNAIKYGLRKPIEVTVSQDANFAKLSVRDSGIGIEEENQKRIFERFERGVSVQHFGGFGLGLFLSNSIIKAHHGRIQVHSKRGMGSLFTVELPL